MVRGIDQWRAKLGWSDESSENPTIEPLTPDAAHNLRLPWLSRFNPQTLSHHLTSNPGMALYVPATGEYLVAEPWRRRDDIANISEVTARKGGPALVRRLLADLEAKGNRLVMLADEVWRDNSRLYLDLGFGKLQTIVFFEKSLSSQHIEVLDNPDLPKLSYSRINIRDLNLLLKLDHNSFPWLWWNSFDEFEGYIQLPDVSVYVASEGGLPVGYASYTLYSGWAHLDRLAVVADRQGHGYGAAQLLHVLTRMVEVGARDVGLSTQSTNLKSHNLYKRFGFRLTNESLSFYGVKLDPTVTIE